MCDNPCATESQGSGQRSSEVIWGHKQFFANNTWQDRARDAEMVPNDLSRRDASVDMQHDLIGSWPDLDLRSNFDLDLSRSSGICFESSWREKHDGVKIISVSLLVQKLFTKNDFRQKRKFLVWGPLEPKLLNLGRIWRKNVTGA